MEFAVPISAGEAKVTTGPVSGAAMAGIDRQQQRRERSRVHAKKSRDKKKVLFETLEEEAAQLQKENEQLRALIHDRLPDKAQVIVGECCYNSKHKDPLLAGLGVGDFDAGNGGEGESKSRTKELVQTDFGLIESLTKERRSFVLTDPRLPDNPIVYASCAFCNLTGYSRDEVIGRNCRFLQGPETDSKAVEALGAAIASGRDATVVLLNFKKDGAPFWNQFFVAALRDRLGNIVNYVGVQSETKEQTADGKAPKKSGNPKLSNRTGLKGSGSSSANMSKIPSPTKLGNMEMKPAVISTLKSDPNSDDDDDGLSIEGLDWSMLAEALETDYADEVHFDAGSWADDDDADVDGVAPTDEQPTRPSTTSTTTSSMQVPIYDGSDDHDRMGDCLESFVRSPRAFTTKTVRSEVIDSLLQSHGDTTDSRFKSALDVLSSVYKASGQNACSGTALSDFLNGAWRNISRPAYEGCLGTNECGDFLYSLEKISFGMFKPPHLRCSVQRTMSNIGDKTDGAPTIVPWSLRRELAMLDPDDVNDQDENDNANPQPSSMVKSYDIAVSLTIEPDQMNASRLKALKVVKGYMLPDPITPNRLTIWFTGGSLSPAPESMLTNAMVDETETRNANFERWKAVFGGKHKKSWTESFRDMGAKLFLGAELPDGMGKDGTMSYSLHRPYGGHGKAYVDVIYLDSNVLVMQGNRGTIYAMVRDSALPPERGNAGTTGSEVSNPTPAGSTSSCYVHVNQPHSRKRKVEVPGSGGEVAPLLADGSESNDYGLDIDFKSNPHISSKKMKLSPHTAMVADSNQFFDLSTFQPPSSNDLSAGATPFSHSVEQQSDYVSSSDGIKNILHSVESFFTGFGRG